MSSEVFSCVREKENKMIIKNNNGPSEPLPPRTDAPPLQPDGADRPSAGPRKMLDEKKLLAIVPFSRATLFRMEKAGTFPRGTYISPNRKIWYEDEIVSWQNSVDEYNANRGRGKGRRPRANPT
jgi:prophage regulatory protein